MEVQAVCLRADSREPTPHLGTGKKDRRGEGDLRSHVKSHHPLGQVGFHPLLGNSIQHSEAPICQPQHPGVKGCSGGCFIPPPSRHTARPQPHNLTVMSQWPEPALQPSQLEVRPECNGMEGLGCRGSTPGLQHVAAFLCTLSSSARQRKSLERKMKPCQFLAQHPGDSADRHVLIFLLWGGLWGWG